MKILLLSDIHGNYPALVAIEKFFKEETFAAICNCGDSLVYGPFANETLHWLMANNVHSILGNTDKKVKNLLRGKTFSKPRKEDKRIMYTWTADHLDAASKEYLFSLQNTCRLNMAGRDICLFHGSPEHPHEFLFPDTEPERFQELAVSCPCAIIITGHSHTPYHKIIGHTHFINPGSVGRMFDSNSAASCAVLTLNNSTVQICHYRINWPVAQMTLELKKNKMPDIYTTMYLQGKKLN